MSWLLIVKTMMGKTTNPHVYLAINTQDSELVFILVINALIRMMEGGWQI